MLFNLAMNQPVLTGLNRTASPLRDRSLIVAWVVLVHASLLWLWLAMPAPAKPAHHEMSVSIATMPSLSPAATPPAAPAQKVPVAKPVAMPETVTKPELRPEPVLKSETAELRRASAETALAAAPVATTALAEAVHAPTPAAPSGLPDHEPDFQAAYLSNPVPAYPMMARRMGWQGKVVLNVEVLASGLPGQIKLHQSCGHELMDNAAMNTVKSWHFTPARHAGRSVTQWFKVPINFSLEDNEA